MLPLILSYRYPKEKPANRDIAARGTRAGPLRCEYRAGVTPVRFRTGTWVPLRGAALRR